jgi:hypothetical protein
MSPLVIFGAVRSTVSSFCSRGHAADHASRLVGLGRRVEEVDGGHDAVAGVDERVAVEARQLAEAGSRLSSTLLMSRSCGSGRGGLRQSGHHERVVHPGVWNTFVVVAREDDHAAMLNHALIQSRPRYRS